MNAYWDEPYATDHPHSTRGAGMTTELVAQAKEADRRYLAAEAEERAAYLADDRPEAWEVYRAASDRFNALPPRARKHHPDAPSWPLQEFNDAVWSGEEDGNG